MKKLLVVTVLLSLSLCVCGDKMNVSSQERMSVTRKEGVLLCNSYDSADLIRKCILIDNQKNCLTDIRSAREYLQNKYEGIDFYFQCVTSRSELSDSCELLFNVKGYSNSFTVRVSDNGIYDNYYGEIIRHDYDKAVESLIKDSLGISCYVYTDFPFCLDFDLSSTVEDIFALGRKLGRTSYIYVNTEDNISASDLKQLLKDNNLYGSYQLIEGYSILQAYSSSQDAYTNISPDMEVKYENFDCFDVK